MQIFLFALIVTLASLARAEDAISSYVPGWVTPAEHRVIFNPVVSASARTLPQWQVGFQRASGANIHSGLIANALSVGVLPRVEVGIIPLFFVNGSSNFTGKLNFFKGEEFDWASSFTQTRFKSNLDEQGNPDIVLRSFQIGANYHPVSSNFIVSPFANYIFGYIDSTDSKSFTQSLITKIEYGVDLQWQLKDREWLTFAFGNIRNAGLSPYEDMNSGAGVAYSQFRPSEMFSRPSVGVYYSPATGNTQYLVSTTFYEL